VVNDFEKFSKDFDTQWQEMEATIKASEAWQRVSLKKVYISKMMSEETTCFSASIVVDGKIVGEAQNRGEGGNTQVFMPEELINELAETIPTSEFMLATPWLKMETLVDQKLGEHEVTKEAKKVMQHVSVIHDGKIFETKMKLKELWKMPLSKQKEVHDILQQRHPGCTFLPFLKMQEALELIVKALR